jgi:hypothetical protein
MQANGQGRQQMKAETWAFVAAAVVVASPAGAACIARGKHDPASLKAICDFEAAWGQSFVTADPSAARSMLADDFVGIDTKGKPYRKVDELTDIARPAHLASDQLNDVTVRFYDNAAVAQGSESWIGKNGRKGRFVWTDVWVKRNHKWQVVAAEDLIPRGDN